MMKTLTSSRPASVCVSVFFSMMALCVASVVHASDATTESEKRYLIQITQEIAHVRELAQKAQMASDRVARVQFDYGALLSDLTEIKNSIERHVDQPVRSPRVITPIRKDYEKPVEKEAE